jgi:hypothetical protein
VVTQAASFDRRHGPLHVILVKRQIDVHDVTTATISRDIRGMAAAAAAQQQQQQRRQQYRSQKSD